MTDLKDLKELAEAAIEADKTHTGLYPAGVWQVVEYGDDTAPGICVHSGDAWRVCFMATIQSRKDYEHQMAKAQHIAGASPQTVLELIARVEAAELDLKSEKLLLEATDHEISELRAERDDLTQDVDAYHSDTLHLIDQRNAAQAERDSLRTALSQAKAREAELLGALEPFAKLADFWLERASIHGLDDEDTCATEIEFGHLRNAVTAMGGDDNG